MKKKSKIIIRIILAAAAAAFTLLYIGPVITTGQINIGLLTGFALACAALIYAAFFDKINAVLCKITANKAGKFAEKCGLIPHSYPSKTPWNGYMPFASREVYGILYQVFL